MLILTFEEMCQPLETDNAMMLNVKLIDPYKSINLTIHTYQPYHP